MNNVNNGFFDRSESSSLILPNIFSFCDLKDHGRLALVCKFFNDIVCSGTEEGKKAREYLFGRLNVEQINFSITPKGLEKIMRKIVPTDVLKMSNVSLTTEQIDEIFKVNNFEEQVSKIESMEPFKNAVVKYVGEFISQDEELNGVALANYIKDPTSETSKNFINNLCIEIIAYAFNYHQTSEEIYKLGELIGTLPSETEKENTLQLFEKYEIYMEGSRMVEFPKPLLENEIEQLSQNFALTEEQKEELRHGRFSYQDQEDPENIVDAIINIAESRWGEEQQRVTRRSTCTDLLVAGTLFLINAAAAAAIYNKYFGNN